MWGTTQLKAIEFGNVTHEILAFVKTAHDIPLALMKAVENGLIVLSQKPEMEQTLREVIAHPELEMFFAEGNTIFNEQTILRQGRETIKPDRVVVNASGQAFLLDYKTGKHLDKYEKQLSNYQFALEEMGLQVAKKTLVYIGEDINVINLP
jgi:RecB family exonuclease